MKALRGMFQHARSGVPDRVSFSFLMPRNTSQYCKVPGSQSTQGPRRNLHEDDMLRLLFCLLLACLLPFPLAHAFTLHRVLQFVSRSLTDSLLMADELKAFAMSVAAEVLPRELERLSTDELATLQSLCSEDEQTMLVDALASSFVTFLLVPPGDATSKLSAALPEPEKLALAELYWRCIVAVALMPEPSLENLARHHPDLQKGHLAKGYSETASTVPRRRLLVEAILPRFAMTCTTHEDAEASERRKKEIAEMKARAEAEEAAEAATEVAATAASSKSTATTGSTARSTTEDAGPTEDGVLL